MNKFDEKYEIRMAKYEDIEDIMEFIDKYWKKDHILARDRDFFEYEMIHDGQVNFIIARDRESYEIVGLHGYVLASKNILDGWGSIWKILPNTMCFLGLELAKRMEIQSKTRAILAMGAREGTGSLHMKVLRKFDDVGIMKQFYCLSKREEYKIAKVEHYEEFVKNPNVEYDIIRIKTIREFEAVFNPDICKDSYPYKDKWYVEHRFFNHPIYNYELYGIKRNEQVEAFFVCREVEYQQTKILRIVDYYGKIELFEGVSSFLEKKLTEYEYIDFYCYGIDYSYIKKAGMIERTQLDTNIIPNYFAPFVQKNIDIHVGTPKGKACFFKADGDQDRPV